MKIGTRRIKLQCTTVQNMYICNSANFHRQDRYFKEKKNYDSGSENKAQFFSLKGTRN